MGTPEIPGLSDLRLLAKGGFSTVYRARQEQFDRLVAVKVLNEPMEDQKARDRFQRECRLAGSLSGHPNVLSLYDAGFTPDGRGYMVLEYMGGGSLASRLATGAPMAPEEVTVHGARLANALAALHAGGIVHCDIKPANILISDFGELKLADFGISRRAGRADDGEGDDSLTVAYAAPEVIVGEPSTPAADIYSLGCTLFALLTGHSPHRQQPGETSAQLLSRIVSTEPPPLELPDGHPELAAAILRALARSPGERWASAAEMAGALAAASPVRDTTAILPVIAPGPRTDPDPQATVRRDSAGLVAAPPAGSDPDERTILRETAAPVPVPAGQPVGDEMAAGAVAERRRRTPAIAAGLLAAVAVAALVVGIVIGSGGHKASTVKIGSSSARVGETAPTSVVATTVPTTSRPAAATNPTTATTPSTTSPTPGGASAPPAGSQSATGTPTVAAPPPAGTPASGANTATPPATTGTPTATTPTVTAPRQTTPTTAAPTTAPTTAAPTTVTTAPPGPGSTITLTWDGPAPPSDCQGDPTCTYINYSLANFAPGNYNILFYASISGMFYQTTVYVGSNGTGGRNNNVWVGYGNQNVQVWATVNGIRSNTLSTPGNPKYG